MSKVRPIQATQEQAITDNVIPIGALKNVVWYGLGSNCRYTVSFCKVCMHNMEHPGDITRDYAKSWAISHARKCKGRHV